MKNSVQILKDYLKEQTLSDTYLNFAKIKRESKPRF